MATYEDDDEDKKREPDADSDDAESPDDIIVGPDAPVTADPQIMTMTGAPAAAAGPAAVGGGDPRQRGFGMGMGFGPMRGAFGHGGPGGPPGAPGGAPQGPGGFGHGGPGGGFLQQLLARIQEARAGREQQRGERFQQFAGTPMGQQFMASPMGQRIGERHPDWMPAPAAPAPAAIVEGDHTGQPAMPPTAAAAANAQATAAPAAAAAPQPAAAAAPQMPAAPSRDQRRPSPMGVQQRQPQAQRPTMFGNNASASIQDEIKRRQGMGGGRRMF